MSDTTLTMDIEISFIKNEQGESLPYILVKLDNKSNCCCIVDYRSQQIVGHYDSVELALEKIDLDVKPVVFEE